MAIISVSSLLCHVISCVTCLKPRRRSVSGLVGLSLWILLVCDNSEGVNGARPPPTVAWTCNNETEFTCINLNCIPLDKVNNTVNDCGDNSEEVADPCKHPAFSCYNKNCVPNTWTLDGVDDCHDGSDEAKIVGTDCSMIDTCCECDQYVDHSECRAEPGYSTVTCQCRSGFYSNLLGTECIRRVIGDMCTVNADCFNAFSNSSCVDSACACDVGYYDSADGSHCVARIIGDTCGIHADCDTVIAYSNCTEGLCACDSGFYRSEDRTICVLRMIGEGCHYHHECFGVGNSSCSEGACTCGRGYKGDLGPAFCNMRRIGEQCLDHPDCPVDGSRCLNSSCVCDLGRYSSEDNAFCRLRVIGDHCDMDVDCTAAMDHVFCKLSPRGQACSCDVGYGAPSGAQRCLSTESFVDVVLVAMNVMLICFLSIIFIVLILYFRRLYQENITKLNRLHEDKNDEDSADSWRASYDNRNGSM